MLGSLWWADRLWRTWLHARAPDLLSRLILQWIQTVMALLGNSEKSKKRPGWRNQGTVFWGVVYPPGSFWFACSFSLPWDKQPLSHAFMTMMLCFITGMEATEPAMTSRLKPIILWIEIKLSSDLVFWVVHPNDTKSKIDKQTGRTKP